MNTRKEIRALLAYSVAAIAIFCLPATLQGGAPDTFSVNFYAYGNMPAYAYETVTLEADQAAGYDDWLTTGWINFLVPWNPTAPYQDPMTITSNKGTETLFQFITCRNGGPYWWNQQRSTLLDDANGDLMDGHVNSTVDAGELFDMEVTNIPFEYYDVIVYLGSQDAQYGDGKGRIVFNGAQRNFVLPLPAQEFSAFDEIVGEGDTGNYIVYKNLTDPSFSIQTEGTGFVGGTAGFVHLGPCGFQIRQINDPNGPIVDAGGDWITWLGQPVNLTGSVTDTPTNTWDLNDLAYSWTAADDPKLDVEISNPVDLNTTVTVTKVPYLQPFVPNAGFENVQSADWINSARDVWGQYNRPAEAVGYGRIYLPNTTYHFPDGINPEGNMACRASTVGSDGESRPDGVAILLGETFDPTATYELSVAVGHPHAVPDDPAYDDNTWNGYLVQLVVGGEVESTGSGADNVYGGTVIAEDPNSIDIARRTWETSTVTYTPNGEFDDLAGQPLQIRLLAPDYENPADTRSTKVFYDDVQLLINGEAGKYVTDPGTPSVNMALTVTEVSTGKTAMAYSTIDVYQDACEARIAKYPEAGFDTGDVDENCMTDLEDYAQLAAKWLYNYLPTAPVPKL